MRRVGSGQRIGSARAVALPYRVPMFDVVNAGTFTRASNATAFTVDSLVTATSGNRRKRNDTVLFEPTRTITMRQSETLGTTWTPTNCSVANNTQTAPSGAVTADVITVTASGSAASLAITLATAPTGSFAMSFWVKAVTTFQTCSIGIVGGAANTSLNFTPTAEWRRYTVTLSGITVAPTITLYAHAFGGTGTAGNDVSIWGLNGANTPVADSYLPTTNANVNRSADSLTVASGSWDTRMATRRIMFTVDFIDTSVRLGAVLYLLSFGGANDRAIMNGSDQVQVSSGGIVRVTSSTLTWGIYQKLTIYLDPAAGTIGVFGATSGNGITAGTPWTWPTGVTFRVGGQVAGSSEAFAWISNIYPW